MQGYTQGDNSAGAQIVMKPPILTRISAEGGEDFQRKFVVCTHLPLGDVNGHPEPTSDHVYIEHMPEMTVYVSTFQGIGSEEKWTYETRRLAETLRNEHNVRMDFYVTATYISPFQIVSDRHEIWFVKFDPKHRLAIKNKTPELRYGSQKLEVPAMFSWALGLLLTYISILISVVKTTFNVSVFVKNNWNDIKERVVVVAKTLQDNVIVGAISRSGVAVIASLWKLTTAVVTGVSDSANDIDQSPTPPTFCRSANQISIFHTPLSNAYPAAILSDKQSVLYIWNERNFLEFTQILYQMHDHYCSIIIQNCRCYTYFIKGYYFIFFS
ncbi:uncharacterized protein LOC127866622 isoform X3 [Dreissena polymorpha]|nr:uncharacterized protein LOC127866622 isoform X3 [Dreissena polymorpha]XP_052263271.1 uncharacterized protein LOC127866622 isoform X3 [Dreissena polymorpha]XP_052263272.1 uncharacterized protein LOC127866622 isoform X3 [Dreissena polymorpha]